MCGFIEEAYDIDYFYRYISRTLIKMNRIRGSKIVLELWIMRLTPITVCNITAPKNIGYIRIIARLCLQFPDKTMIQGVKGLKYALVAENSNVQWATLLPENCYFCTFLE